MMNDLQASAGVSKHLSALATSYKYNMVNFAAEQVAVPLHCPNLVTGSYQRNQASWSDIVSDIKSRGQKAMELDSENETLINFAIDDHAARYFISERDFMLRDQAGISRDQVIANEVRRVTGSLMTQREKRLADLLTNSANYNASNTATAANAWSSASGTPIDDILAAIAQIAKGPAKASDYFMVADESVYIALLGNPQVKAALSGLAFGADYSILSKILHVTPVVCKAGFNGSTGMYGTNAIIYKRPAGEIDPMDEGAECSWRLAHNTESPVIIKQYTEPGLDGVWIEGQSNYKIINGFADNAGKFNTAYLIGGVTA